MNIGKKEVAGWIRWLHIYLSMFSFGTLLFFAVTGITLNHTEWIEGKQTITQHDGMIDSSWVTNGVPDVRELEIVEYLRNTYHIRAPLKDFSTDDEECMISFKGPGYNADAFISRPLGSYELTITESGLVAVMNDLHKGRDSGSVWAGLIDVSAVLMILVSLTGLAMIFFLRKWRPPGLTLSLIGFVLLVIIYFLFV